MFTKSQEVAEAKKAFLVRTCCPHGARKGAKKKILLATKGQKKQETSKAEMEWHFAERPKTDVPDNWRGDVCRIEPQDLEDYCDGAMWTTHDSTTVSNKQ